MNAIKVIFYGIFLMGALSAWAQTENKWPDFQDSEDNNSAEKSNDLTETESYFKGDGCPIYGDTENNSESPTEEDEINTDNVPPSHFSPNQFIEKFWNNWEKKPEEGSDDNQFNPENGLPENPPYSEVDCKFFPEETP